MIPGVHNPTKGKINLELVSIIVIRINPITRLVDSKTVAADTTRGIVNFGGMRGNGQGAIDIGGIATVEIRQIAFGKMEVGHAVAGTGNISGDGAAADTKGEIVDHTGRHGSGHSTGRLTGRIEKATLGGNMTIPNFEQTIGIEPAGGSGAGHTGDIDLMVVGVASVIVAVIKVND